VVLLQAVVSGLLLGGIYALVSVGLTLTFGVVRIANFAHGEFLMVGMFLAWVLHERAGIDPYLACLIVGPALFAMGFLVERSLIRPVIQASHMAQIFVTVGLAVFLQNGALMIWGADHRGVILPYADRVWFVGPIVLSLPRVVAFAVAMALCLALLAFLRWTYWGKAVRATAEDREITRVMGIDTGRVYSLTFATGAALAGIAGALLLPMYAVYPTVGIQFVLVAFIVAVLGGLGSAAGAILAGLVIGVVEVVSGFLIAPGLQQALYFIVFLLVLIVRPAGLLGRRGAEELVVT
jgi:branched-chain amino acid transport system permease protein